MFIFHGKRCVVGCELVGTKTCGSTLSSACSRSFLAYFAIPIELANFPLEISQPCTRALQPLVRAHNSYVIPHQTSDLVPIVINHDQFIDVLHVPRLPLWERHLPRRMRRALSLHSSSR